MQDRPTAGELLKAVERFLDEEIVPNTQGTRQFHARVAANVMRILAREWEHEEAHLEEEWAGLDDLLGPEPRPPSRRALREALTRRNGQLCDRIRAGEADDGPYRERTLAHVRRTVRAKLLVDNPAWLEEP